MDTEGMSMQGTPPTEQELAERRCAAAAMLAQCAKRDRMYRLAVCGAVLIALATAALMWPIEINPFPDASAIAIVAAIVAQIVGANVIVVAAVNLYGRWIDDPRTAGNAVLSDLVWLEPSSHPEECIAFVSFAEADDTVRAYQHRLVALGRKPVLGEYRAAKDWMDHKGTRLAEERKIEHARHAYSQFWAAI